MSEDNIFEGLEVGGWKVGQLPNQTFMVTSIREEGGNRIVKRKRPYREGAKLDDTGSEETIFHVTAIFDNDVHEPGIDQTTPIYPNQLDGLIDSFGVHSTGDLTIPTRGSVRARLHKYTRTEGIEPRDHANLSMIFVVDNEDNVDANSLGSPTVSASASRTVEQARFDATSEGLWDTSIDDLVEFGSQLESIANSPGETLNELDRQANVVMTTTDRVVRAFSQQGNEDTNLLSDPENSRTQRRMETTKDMAGRSRSESGSGRRKMVPYKVNQQTDIFTIAASIGQDATDLIEINPGINALLIPKGAVIRIFEAS